MISSDDLATVNIRRVIFHDVPRNIKGGAAQPTLSEVQTEIDATRKTHLKSKLVRVINSKSAYPVRFNPDSSSPVPPAVRSLTVSHGKAAEFVGTSQQLANHLFEQHSGATSAGLLCVIDVAVHGTRNGLVLMKLEREEGAQLQLDHVNGKRTFSMSVLDNLVLTDGTRLFKTAMFIRTGSGNDDFSSAVCDSQLNVMNSDDIAKFWLRFLGCTFLEEPRVTTHRFFDSTVRFINEAVTDPIVKNDIYEHLQSQLKAPTPQFAPKTFIENFVPPEYQKQFQEHLNTVNVPLTAFTKDVGDIQASLRRRAYKTKKGAIISVPAAEADLVVVGENDVTVKDKVAVVR